MTRDGGGSATENAAAAAGGRAVTRGTLFGGRLTLLQPAAGYRAAIDPVLLAASVPAGPDETIVDAGCGVGAVALCLAVRCPGCRIIGLEIDPALVALARRNAVENGLDARLTVRDGDIRTIPAGALVDPPGVDRVVINPPYLEAGRHTPAPDPGKARAHGEQPSGAGLADWIAFAARILRPRGRLALIHRADRIDHLLSTLRDRSFGAISVFPLWPRVDAPARRIIVHARRDVRSPARLLAGLVLHRPEGGFTEAAEAVLRQGAALDGLAGAD